MTSSTPRAGWKGLQLRRLVPAQPDEWAACCIPAQLPAFLHTCKRRKARIRPSRTPSPALPSLPPPWFTPCTADGLCSRPRGKRKALASRKARDVGNRWAGPKGSHACVASPWGPVARSWAGIGNGDAVAPLPAGARSAVHDISMGSGADHGFSRSEPKTPSCWDRPAPSSASFQRALHP